MPLFMPEFIMEFYLDNLCYNLEGESLSLRSFYLSLMLRNKFITNPQITPVKIAVRKAIK
jgi:hypothetical protein